MLWEKQIEYAGSLLAIAGSIYTIVNLFIYKNLRNLYIGYSAEKALNQITSDIKLLKNAYVARSDVKLTNIALAYSISLLIKGWAITSVAQLPNFLALIIIFCYNNIIVNYNVNNDLKSQIVNIMIAYFLIISSFVMSNYGRKRIDWGVQIRDSIASRPKFLNRLEKQISRFERKKFLDAALIAQAKNEMLLARGNPEIDWLSR